ncbi:MAG: site-specific integrase [Actinobacteria bacterium]|nr:site-specific integrase [Actinomycetota bacterium]
MTVRNAFSSETTSSHTTRPAATGSELGSDCGGPSATTFVGRRRRWPRRAIARSEVVQNPTLGLSLPAVRGRRERVARPEEARALISALPDGDRALWATALYAGLRRGELQALRWSDVDLEAGVIRVERSFDQKDGPIEPKSRSGRRRVPLAKPLRAELSAHRLRQGGGGEGLVLGNGEKAFASVATVRRARRVWARAGLAPIGLHECRHTYAAFMIAAGVNAKALSSPARHC